MAFTHFDLHVASGVDGCLARIPQSLGAGGFHNLQSTAKVLIGRDKRPIT